METPMAQRFIIVSQSMKNEDAHFYIVDVFLYGCATICVEAYPICRLFYCWCTSECGRREAILLEEWLSILLKANASLGRKTR